MQILIRLWIGRYFSFNFHIFDLIFGSEYLLVKIKGCDGVGRGLVIFHEYGKSLSHTFFVPVSSRVFSPLFVVIDRYFGYCI